jgi:transglutaminase-like putative cysteine protease
MKHGLLLGSIICFAMHVLAQKYKVEKLPDWVKTVDIPTQSIFTKYDVSLGYYLKLSDYQTNLDKSATYIRNVVNVISYSGTTKASQLNVTYDTSYQQLKIHQLVIWRNGEKLDRTTDLNFKILNNEYNLHKGIYMGLITAYCNLDDIRKDDLIDFSYTLIGENPIFNDEKYLFLPLEATNPVDKYTIRIVYSKDKSYSYKCTGCDSSFEIENSIANDYRQLSIKLENLKPITVDDNMPGWTIPYRYFTLSSFKSWKEVNSWAQNVFALKQEPDLSAVFKEIFKGNETTDEKINKIINFVQDDIRYMGIESGIGSIKPFPPDQVVKQRFGDCKDKSLLLVSLLKKIGVNKAYPVLVNTYIKQELHKSFPSNEVFNHCIALFELNDTTYWIDPTFTQQGGDYKVLAVVDYGKVLIIGKPSDSLVSMNIQKYVSGTKVNDVYHIQSFTSPATLRMKSVRSGFDADVRRVMFEQTHAEEYSKYITDDLKRYYPYVNKTADMKLNDDIEKNVFTTTYQYEIDGFWQDGDKMQEKSLAGYWIFRFEPQMLYSDLFQAPCTKRKYDFALNYPLNINYTVEFTLPKEMLIIDRFIKEENESFYFDEKIEQLSVNSFRVVYNYRNKINVIKVDDYERICEARNKLSKNLPIVIYFNK